MGRRRLLWQVRWLSLRMSTTLQSPWEQALSCHWKMSHRGRVHWCQGEHGWETPAGEGGKNWSFPVPLPPAQFPPTPCVPLSQEPDQSFHCAGFSVVLRGGRSSELSRVLALITVEASPAFPTGNSRHWCHPARRKIAEVLIQSIKNYDNVQNTRAEGGHTLKMSALRVPALRGAGIQGPTPNPEAICN